MEIKARRLDAEIAEKVMKLPWPGNGQCTCGGYCPKHGDFPKYSTDIAAAWEVVEKYAANDCRIFCRDGVWEAWLSYPVYGGAMCSMEKGDTAPHAICLAALKAVGEL